MVEKVKGIVAETGDKFLIVMLGGIGIKVWATDRMVSNTKIGNVVHLHTDLVLRETEINLHGFENIEERDMFRALLKVSGIGPKAAMAIVSTLPLPEIYQAIQSKDFNRFTQVPGIGKKTAQKLILFLQDSTIIEQGIHIDPQVATVNSDLLEALVGLGYSVVEAQSCIQSLPVDAPEDLENRLRIALQYFS